jgi:mannosyltransferase OCH1-like enzyme
VLLEYGGIYLDIDTYVIRPFAEHSLMLHDVVMGMEARELKFLRSPMSDDEMDPAGLCNGIIIARKGAEFLRRWMESYEGFVERHWAEHSVVSTQGVEADVLLTCCSKCHGSSRGCTRH